MFALIVSILAIALVALTVLATTYWGGSAFSGGSSKAAISSIFAIGKQVNAALVAYRARHGALPPQAALYRPYPSLNYRTRLPASLAPKYLKAIPAIRANGLDATRTWLWYRPKSDSTYQVTAILGFLNEGHKAQSVCAQVNALPGGTSSKGCVRCRTRFIPTWGSSSNTMSEAYIMLSPYYWYNAAGALKRSSVC